MLILIAATLVVQLLSFVSVISIRSRETRSDMATLIAADLRFVQNHLRTFPAAERERWLAQLDRGIYRLLLQPAQQRYEDAHDSTLNTMAQALRQRLPPEELVRGVRLHDAQHADTHALLLQLDSSEDLLVVFERSPPFSPPSVWIILGYLAAMSVPILALAGLAVRQATAPLARMVSAAEQLGHNLHATPMPEEGPEEVQRAARAINRMQQALLRQFDARSQILAAVSHDLKTPLTRLRLRAEALAQAPQREAFTADIELMAATIQDGLDYAHSERLREPLVAVDLQRMTQNLVEDQREMGAHVELHGHIGHAVRAAPRALQRVLQNLLDNALRYGHSAQLTLQIQGGQAQLWIDDEGPGIPSDKLDQVFEPFVRLEHSRSRETGGSGLGLTIARNLMRSQGGELQLSNRPEGGLRASVTLSLHQG